MPALLFWLDGKDENQSLNVKSKSSDEFSGANQLEGDLKNV